MIRLDIRAKDFAGVPVLGPLVLSVAPGETVALLGPSGSGKSTLLRIAAGLERDFVGQAQVTGRLGVVFQEPALLKWRTALANITLMTGAAPARARALMAEMGLGGLEERYPGQMSLGQQRRLAIARALAAEAEVLLLDEPFASLDPENAAAMVGLVARTLRERRLTCLLVTHDLGQARALAGRIFRLEGRPAGLVPVAGPSGQPAPRAETTAAAGASADPTTMVQFRGAPLRLN